MAKNDTDWTTIGRFVLCGAIIGLTYIQGDFNTATIAALAAGGLFPTTAVRTAING